MNNKRFETLIYFKKWNDDLRKVLYQNSNTLIISFVYFID